MYKETFNRYIKIFNGFLDEYLNEYCKELPEVFAESIKYSIVDGGKRVRPVLCFATAEMLGVNIDVVKNFALAIEMIHSYSLVHDDLPSMDNDDYRRGKLSTHKKFGEALGVLTGDGLLNLAFETCMAKPNLDTNDIEAVRVIANYAGAKGMIAGQVYDIESSIEETTEDNLYRIYLNKTAKLITLPLLVASCMKNKLYYNELKELGYNLGYLFQITDDILDVEGSLETLGKTPHKDVSENKLTAIKVFGLSGAKEKAKEHYTICKNILNGIPNSKFLQDFTDSMYLRKN